MKAIRYSSYGSPDVLEVQDLARPAIGDNDVLVRVRAVSVNPLDWHYIRGMPYAMRAVSGLSRPKVNGLGTDLAGQVEAVGGNVTEFAAGDEVFGYYGPFEGGEGTLAEYVRVPHDGPMLRKPDNLTFEEAASVPVAGMTALQGLRRAGRIRPGQKVLINGAAGGVGTFAVQLAKALGAEVTGVCSTGNVEMVRSIGADHVLDYTKEDFAREDRRYDLILDNVGNRSLAACRRALTPRGTLVENFGSGDRWVGPMWRNAGARMLSLFVRQRLVNFLARADRADLAVLRDLLQEGKIKPVIDRTYRLEESPEAIRYLEEGHARGKVVVAV
ncbi:NAD(P)-dependent alcohol dehydrogenase [Nonomuraea sp. H19]|uniref:NAD(P)-dependent alcohol dehydrogenase n=1 Tax=Nonomuraea sp. H19 TaxID=3452206 RepID=UPI003F887045